MNYINWVKYKMYDSFESIYQELNIRLDLYVKVSQHQKIVGIGTDLSCRY